MDLVIALHTVATLCMTGVIWFVQLVHYPLFAAVPPSAFVKYESRHTRRTTWVVAPPMVVEALTAGALVLRPPTGIPPFVLWVGAALVGVMWISTTLVQVPCHRRLGQGFCRRTHARLVTSNWIRTAVWTVRGMFAVWIARAA